MAVYTVNDDIIRSQSAAAHFSTADRRIMIGLRATLEMLGIPIPEYAQRKPTGRPPSRVIAAAFRADNPQQAPAPLTYQRKANANSTRVTAAKLARAGR